MDEVLAWIYPNRIAIGLATAALGALVAIVGWRRGWHRVARRHPRTTGLGVAGALAVGLPLAWYLGSPLFLRSELVEPAPVLDAAVTSPSPAASPAASGSLPAAAPSRTPVATAAPSLASFRGRFVGADDFHFARGTARLVETAPKQFTLRLENFSVRNGPDLFVYLSPDPRGYTKGSFELGRLKATDGSFNYLIPSEQDVSTVRSVVIWCKAFSVQFGVAELRG